MPCPAHLSISHRPAQRLACFHPWRVLSERVPRDSQTSALSGSVRSTSDFAGTVPARNTCLAALAPVAAHHDMTACLCVSLFIGSICVRSNLSCWKRNTVPDNPRNGNSTLPSETARAQRLADSLAQLHANACLLSCRQKAGPDFGIKLVLCQI